MRVFRLILCLLVGCLSAQIASAAMLRPIPGAAKKVEMTFVGGMQVAVGDSVRTLSPGAQIRDTSNRIVLPSYVSGKYIVRALTDNYGQIHRVWILTPEEIAVPDPKQ
ncbi:hypothetical protein [Azoarcus sp. L1K30]|uniref:hypothetical protein n=1 Tax=Azoarcus sp. L1K30 TaxID=2820277 RepID=UPI0032C2237C